MRARPDVAEGGGVVVGGDDSHRLFGGGVLSVKRVREAVLLSPGLAWAYHLDGVTGGVSEWERKGEVDNYLGEQLCLCGGREGLRGFCDDVVCEIVEVEVGKLGRFQGLPATEAQHWQAAEQLRVMGVHGPGHLRSAGPGAWSEYVPQLGVGSPPLTPYRYQRL